HQVARLRDVARGEEREGALEELAAPGRAPAPRLLGVLPPFAGTAGVGPLDACGALAARLGLVVVAAAPAPAGRLAAPPSPARLPPAGRATSPPAAGLVARPAQGKRLVEQPVEGRAVALVLDQRGGEPPAPPPPRHPR